MRKSIFFAVPLMAAVLISACSDSGDDNNTPPPANEITGKIDYAGKPISSAKVCLDVNNNGLADDTACGDTDSSGKYSFTSDNNPAYYPLAAFIKEANRAVNAKIAVDKSDYDSILYAPRGKTDNISITTTLAKSLMDKDSSLSLASAEETAAAIVEKADNPETVLTVYNNALNTAPDSIDISTSIRGLVSVITDKLSKETKITESNDIAVTQEEIDTANSDIKEEDNKLPQKPENPSGEPVTPLEKVTEMLAGAEIKNSAESPVNLNEFIDDNQSDSSSSLNIRPDAFGEFSSNVLMTGNQLLLMLNYEEEGWPSDKGFEVVPEDNCYIIDDNVCSANGKVNGIYYKSVFDENLYTEMIQKAQVCYEENGGTEDTSGEVTDPNDINIMGNCLAETAYDNKDSIKIEKWYWTIDTTQLYVCK